MTYIQFAIYNVGDFSLKCEYATKRKCMIVSQTQKPSSIENYFGFKSLALNYQEDAEITVHIIFEDGYQDILTGDSKYKLKTPWQYHLIKLRIPESKMGIGFRVMDFICKDTMHNCMMIFLFYFSQIALIAHPTSADALINDIGNL